MFKWKGMTSRVPLHAIQYDCANAITSCRDLFLFSVSWTVRDRGYTLLLASYSSSATKVGNFQLSDVTNYKPLINNK